MEFFRLLWIFFMEARKTKWQVLALALALAEWGKKFTDVPKEQSHCWGLLMHCLMGMKTHYCKASPVTHKILCFQVRAENCCAKTRHTCCASIGSEEPTGLASIPCSHWFPGTRPRISSQACVGCTDLQQQDLRRSIFSLLVPSHTEVWWSHPELPVWSGCFRPGNQHQEESTLCVILLCVLHIHTRTKDNLAGWYFTALLLFLYHISIFLSLCLLLFLS